MAIIIILEEFKNNDNKKKGIFNISKMEPNVKMFNMPQTQTYKRLANYCSSSRQNSLSQSRIKTTYKVKGGKKSEDYGSSKKIEEKELLSRLRLSDINK